MGVGMVKSVMPELWDDRWAGLKTADLTSVEGWEITHQPAM